MSDVATEPQADDYLVDLRIRLPRAPYKRLRHVAENKYQSTPGKVAEAVLKAWLGGDFEVEQEKPQPRRKYTDPGVREEVQQLLAAGLTPHEVAANFDIDSRTALRWITAATGAPLPPRAAKRRVVSTAGKGRRVNVFSDADNLATFKSMYEDGKSDAEIARALGCSESTVQGHRKMRGLLPVTKQHGATA